MPPRGKPKAEKAFLRRSKDYDMLCRLLADGPLLKRQASQWDKVLVYNNHRYLRYPLIDHETLWKVAGAGPGATSAHLIVSHAYWHERSAEQLEQLRGRLSGKGVSVVVARDAAWGNDKTEIKQVFIGGSDVDMDRVLSLPYGFFDDRCSEPAGPTVPTPLTP